MINLESIMIKTSMSLIIGISMKITIPTRIRSK